MALIHGHATHAAGAHLLPYKYDPGVLRASDVEIKISHCGVCHSDVHLIDNDWGISQYPFIPGHEIVGTITAVGDKVKLLKTGQRVGVGWQSDSCGVCEWCMAGEEQLCAKAQPTCVGRNGGYAGAIRINERFAVPLPDELDSAHAAPLLCAGITVFNPLRQHGAGPGSRVAVIGVGGLGHLAIQFARALGADVTALSSTVKKEADARALGAHHFVHTRETSALKKIASSYDLILSTANADQDWPGYVAALRPKGTLCVLGAAPSPISVPAFSLISASRSITGSNTGSPSQIKEMLEVAAKHGVKATIQSFPMAKADEAVSLVKKNKVHYRAVLAI